MKISLNWIKQFVDIPSKYSAKELAELLTLRTCEVEGYEDQCVKFANMVVGQIITVRPHPNADKLRLVDTDIGRNEPVQVVCGGVNLAEGMFVPVALPGAVVNWHGAGEVVELKETKIRGEKSFGMICAGEEIGLPKSPPEYITDLSELWAKMGLKKFAKSNDLAKPGTPLAVALNLNDVVLEVENKSLTHRPDLWGHYGMAREFAAFLGKKLKPLVPKVTFPSKGQSVKVEIKNKEIAKRFLSTIITGVKIAPSPDWMQKQLEAVGLRPVNNIVDITNYVMLETGYPMHAFGRRFVKNNHFVIRYAATGEVVETIDHKKYKLTSEDALVTNDGKALAIAGIMGGLNSEVKSNTTEIILEVGNWNPVMIRKTSQRHNLRTDAAQRFEKSLDPVVAELTMRRACELILQICPGSQIAGPMTDSYPKKTQEITVTLDVAKTSNKIGVQIPEKEMIKYLEALEFKVAKAGKGKLKITVPSFRATKDVNIEDDLVEEVARMYGYEKITPVLPELPIKLPMENRERTLKHKLKQIMSFGLGFNEVSHYSFYGRPEIRKAMLPENLHVQIENPLTEDQTHLRISLLPHILKSVALNLYNREEFKLYEVGRTYVRKGKGTRVKGTDDEECFPLEEKFVCGVVVKKPVTLSLSKGDRGEIFYEGLGALQSFLEQFGVKARIEEALNPPPYAHPTKCAAVKVGDLEIAVVYEVHPQVLRNFGIEAAVAAFEINYTQLVANGQMEKSYKSLPRFPGIEIDVSVLVNKKTTVREIQNLIKTASSGLVVNVSLIDIFENKSLGEDKKSFTFRVLLQSPDRTLTDEEMKEVQEKIFENLRGAGFVIRGE